jgi:hypothetical protein
VARASREVTKGVRRRGARNGRRAPAPLQATTGQPPPRWPAWAVLALALAYGLIHASAVGPALALWVGMLRALVLGR